MKGLSLNASNINLKGEDHKTSEICLWGFKIFSRFRGAINFVDIS